MCSTFPTLTDGIKNSTWRGAAVVDAIETIEALRNVARAGDGIRSIRENGMPFIETQCMCAPPGICPLHYLREALDALPEWLLEADDEAE